MAYFEAKMHQIRSRLGFAPDAAGEAYMQHSPAPLARFQGSTAKVNGGEGR